MTTISSEQVRAARALLRWEQKDLAERSKLALGSIKRLEVQPGALAAQTRTVDAIRTTLEAAGVIFVEENGEGPGVRLRKERPMPDRFKPGTRVKFAQEANAPIQYRGQTAVVIERDAVADDPSKDRVRWDDGYECAYPGGTFIASR